MDQKNTTGYSEPGSDGSLRASNSTKPTKELKVEDALHYLDQVKLEFSDKPQIYNEFLEIMKTFKAEAIDTRGVIEQVRNLFRGYNKLILGFNTFLPEGYKIELTPEEVAYDQQLEREALANASAATKSPLLAPKVEDTSNVQIVESSQNPSSGNDPEPGKPAAPQQVQQQHAITYVTTIRNRFANQPETYKSFLKILHTYQREQKGIKEVLEQVSSLFADHPDLLMEFTYFLPDAVQEQAKERLHRAARESEARRRSLQSSAHSHMGPMGAINGMNPAMMNNPNLMLPQSNLSGLNNNPAMMGNMGLANQKKRAGVFDAGSMALFTQGQNAANAMANGARKGQNIASNLPMSAMGANGMMNNPAAANPASSSANQQVMHSIMSQQALQNSQFQQQQQQHRRGQKRSGKEMHGGANYGSYYPNGATAGNATGNIYPTGVAPAQVASNASYGNGVASVTSNAMSSKSKDNDNGKNEGFGGFPLSSHVSVSAERRLFDQIRDFLVTTSRDAWPDFVKVLDLFSEDTLSKKDLLTLVQNLLENGGEELFEDFKRLLSHRGDFELSGQDMWFATPLSEIDFSQCRKCTPSYRALPKDFPKYVYSERSEEEASVLNDQWVSIPIGSEESYSFKHMRKNQYEEALFKCEDDRFEIDMIIDSNVATIRILEPIAREIAAMRDLEDGGSLESTLSAASALINGNTDLNPDTVDPVASSTNSASNTASSGTNSVSSNTPANASSGSNNSNNNNGPHSHHEKKGMIAPKFSFSLEKRNFSTIHLNSIARIYGEHASEILELLRKNPTGAVPVILRRLIQKDTEWRKARKELNTHWKEIVDRNYEKSFDHRSFYFRQQDRRNYSAKHLVADVKGTAVESGLSLAEMNLPSVLSRSSCDDATKATTPLAQKPDASLFLQFPMSDFTVHKAIFQLLCYAAEFGSMSFTDKEKVPAIFRDWLRIFFQFPVHFFQSGTASDSDAWSAFGANPALKLGSSLVASTDLANWPEGTHVVTQYGPGRIEKFRSHDSTYEISLAFGKAYMKSSAILGADELMPPAFPAIGVSRSDNSNVDLVYSKELTSVFSWNKDCALTHERVVEPSTTFFGTQACYVFLRIYHTLYVRLAAAKKLCEESCCRILEKRKQGGLFDGIVSENEPCIVENVLLSSSVPGKSDRQELPSFNLYLSQVMALIDGSIDNAKYEDLVRQLLGNKAYMLYTMDKAVSQALRQLQLIGNDDIFSRLIGIYLYHRRRGLVPDGTRNNQQIRHELDIDAFHTHIAQCLIHSSEDIYRLDMMAPSTLGRDSFIAVQCLGSMQNVANSNLSLNSLSPSPSPPADKSSNFESNEMDCADAETMDDTANEDEMEDIQQGGDAMESANEEAD